MGSIIRGYQKQIADLESKLVEAEKEITELKESLQIQIKAIMAWGRIVDGQGKELEDAIIENKEQQATIKTLALKLNEAATKLTSAQSHFLALGHSNLGEEFSGYSITAKEDAQQYLKEGE